jgi:hypothetical protein
MIIQIRDDLFDKVVEIVKHRNLSIYNELKEIKPLDTVATDNTLQKARELKTQKVKQSIEQSIKELLSKDITPTKYKVNKATGIAFITLNKYYDDILELAKREKSNQEEKESVLSLPLVLDAPFSKLGTQNIGLISRKLPEFAEQVIIFMLDKDWEASGLEQNTLPEYCYRVEREYSDISSKSK